MSCVQVRNGHIKRITDQDIQSSVLEIMGTNVSTNHITCPADKNKTLGIKLPFLVMIIKNVSARLHLGSSLLACRSSMGDRGGAPRGKVPGRPGGRQFGVADEVRAI